MDLFGNPVEVSKSITSFADERKNINDNWHYLGLVIIPTEKIPIVISKLKQHKKELGLCDSELKFTGLNLKEKGTKLECARRWLSELLYDPGNLFYFSILGLDKSKIDFSSFGPGETEKGSTLTCTTGFSEPTSLGLYHFALAKKPL